MTLKRARWRRWAVRAAALLALGAVTSVGVAWGCAAWCVPAASGDATPVALTKNGKIRVAMHLSAPGSQVALRIPEFSTESGMTTYYARLTPDDRAWFNERAGWSFDDLPPPSDLDNELGMNETRRAGLPWACVATRASYRAHQSPPRIADSGLVLGGAAGGYRVLPYRPLWTGLALNTLVYSFIWLALFAGWTNVRAAWRRRGIPGCCPKCDFSLAGLVQPGCPECGWGRRG